MSRQAYGVAAFLFVILWEPPRIALPAGFKPSPTAERGPLVAASAPGPIGFSQSAQTIDASDFVEVTLNVSNPDAGNPFTDVTVEGEFGRRGEPKAAVTGFCDSADGTLYRVRFAPGRPGDYSYSVSYREGAFAKSYSGTFRALDGHRQGILRVDPKYRWHFVWEGTGEHYFWNGTTAFFLMAWTDDSVIRGIIDRLRSLEVNRIRALLTGRWATSAGEPVVPEEGYR